MELEWVALYKSGRQEEIVASTYEEAITKAEKLSSIKTKDESSVVTSPDSMLRLNRKS